MTYATLMVNLEMGRANDGILGIAAVLAERFNARVVGISSAEPIMAVYDGGYMSGDLIEEDIGRIRIGMAVLEEGFRSALHGRNGDIEWRSRIMYGSHSEYVAREARCADLVITSATGTGITGGLVDAGELAVQAGRPVLVVPPGTTSLGFGQAVVCWKDTREARRAVRDALPFLRHVAKVDVVEVAPAADLHTSLSRLDDVVAWLKLHGVPAVRFAYPAAGDDAALLEEICMKRDADLVVAGAYGHSRIREWAFGGVSRSLIADAHGVSLLSH
jgi:nucleotide-binding universal stress UspA family protein